MEKPKYSPVVVFAEPLFAFVPGYSKSLSDLPKVRGRQGGHSGYSNRHACGCAPDDIYCMDQIGTFGLSGLIVLAQSFRIIFLLDVIIEACSSSSLLNAYLIKFSRSYKSIDEAIQRRVIPIKMNQQAFFQN